jgi:hypothetical protein
MGGTQNLPGAITQLNLTSINGQIAPQPIKFALMYDFATTIAFPIINYRTKIFRNALRTFMMIKRFLQTAEFNPCERNGPAFLNLSVKKVEFYQILL